MPVSRPNDLITDWSGGVITSGLSIRQSANSSPRGYNSMLSSIGPTGAVPAKRPGMKTVNALNTSIANTEIIGMHEYRTVSAGVFTRYHVFIGDDGRVGTIASDPSGLGSVITVATGIFTDHSRPDFAVAKNLCFITTDTVRKKLRGTTLENFGITRPAAAPAASAGGAGTMTGTFDIRFTYVNGNTNAESSASDSVSVTVAGSQINVTSITASPDTQVTKRRVYIRNQATQTEYRLAATINDNSTLTTTLDVDTANLIILGPDTAENEPPVSTAKFIAWWNNRMFVADDSNLYWSGKNLPESFDPEDFEPIGEGDGQKITGLHAFGDVLLIFKSRSIWYLSGLTPESWRLRPLFDWTGAVSHASIVEAGGSLWWWSDRGVMKWDGAGQPVEVGELLLGDVVEKLNLNQSYTHLIQAAVEPNLKLVLWTYPEVGQTRNTRILPMSYKLSAFVANKWDPMDIASLVSVEDNTGKTWLYMGNYNGQIFRYGHSSNGGVNDGVFEGTLQGTVVAGSTSLTSITGTGFATTGEGDKERYVTFEDSNRQFIARARITSNTATQLNFASTSGFTVGATYTYYIGGPNYEWDTVDIQPNPFVRAALKFLYVQTDAQGSMAGVEVFTSASADTPQKLYSFLAFEAPDKDTVEKRFSIGKVGTSLRARITSRDTNFGFTLYAIGRKANDKTDKLG